MSLGANPAVVAHVVCSRLWIRVLYITLHYTLVFGCFSGREREREADWVAVHDLRGECGVGADRLSDHLHLAVYDLQEVQKVFYGQTTGRRHSSLQTSEAEILGRSEH